MFRTVPLVCAVAAVACQSAFAAPSPAPADATAATLFFQNMGKLCGQRFEGATEFPTDDPGHSLAGKKLAISFERSIARGITKAAQSWAMTGWP
jgi:hypothetical protein